MSNLAVLFAINDNEVANFRAFSTDRQRLNYLQATIEPLYFEQYPQFVVQLDKAWEAIHQAFSNNQNRFHFPLNNMIFGGESLYQSGDYEILLKSTEEVKQIAQAIKTIDEATFRRYYFAIDRNQYECDLSDHDCEYSWENFESSKQFWQIASDYSHPVIFTLDL